MTPAQQLEDVLRRRLLHLEQLGNRIVRLERRERQIIRDPREQAEHERRQEHAWRLHQAQERERGD